MKESQGTSKNFMTELLLVSMAFKTFGDSYLNSTLSPYPFELIVFAIGVTLDIIAIGEPT